MCIKEQSEGKYKPQWESVHWPGLHWETNIWDMETDKVLGVDSVFVSLSVVTRDGCIRDLEKETVGTLGKGEAINNKSWDYSSNAGLIWVTNIYKDLCSYASIKISPSYPLPLSTTGFPLPQTWIGARASLWDVINTWLASLCGTHFESTQWRKVNLNILLCWQFKETFENVHSGEKSNKWNKHDVRHCEIWSTSH